MRNLLFWSLFPLLAPQALYVRRTAPRFDGAAGPAFGVVGDGDECRLLAVGDSIIAGVGAGTLENALVGTTAAALASRLNVAIRWRAFGGIGYKSAAVIEQLLPRLPAEQADFIVVSVGVNDITGLTSLPKWRRNLAELLERLREHSPGATIAMAGIPPLGGFPLLPQPLRAVAGLRASTFDVAGRTVVKRFEKCVHVPVSFDTSPERFAADGYHPSEDSYRIYGAAITDGLMASLGQQEKPV
jgi:lysophospholipase L1-like esterase